MTAAEQEQRRAILQAREAIERLPRGMAGRDDIARAMHGVVDGLEQFVRVSLDPTEVVR